MSVRSSHRGPERVRFLARALSLVFLLGWSAWFWPFDDLLDRQGTPLGADFSMFYVAGQVAADGAWDQLYDQAEHQRRLHTLFPGLSPQFCLPYRYPPIVAALGAPLARFPYPLAWMTFTFASCLALGLAIWLLGRNFATGEADWANWRRAGVWACVGWPVVLEVLIGGQASLFGLLIVVGSCVLLQANRPGLTGAVLALSAYKPNLLALFAVGVVVRYPRAMVGAIPVLTAVVGLSWWIAGPSALLEFASLSAQLASRPWEVETPFWKVHSLASWFGFFLPGLEKTASLVVGFAAAVAIGVWWRRSKNPRIALPLLLVVNALLNPYTPIYDLALLIPAAWMGAGSWRQGDSFPGQALLGTLYFGPHLSQALARTWGVQVFPLVLAGVALVWVRRRGVPGVNVRFRNDQARMTKDQG